MPHEREEIIADLAIRNEKAHETERIDGAIERTIVLVENTQRERAFGMCKHPLRRLLSQRVQNPGNARLTGLAAPDEEETRPERNKIRALKPLVAAFQRQRKFFQIHAMPVFASQRCLDYCTRHE